MLCFLSGILSFYFCLKFFKKNFEKLSYSNCTILVKLEVFCSLFPPRNLSETQGFLFNIKTGDFNSGMNVLPSCLAANYVFTMHSPMLECLSCFQGIQNVLVKTCHSFKALKSGVWIETIILQCLLLDQFTFSSLDSPALKIVLYNIHFATLAVFVQRK